MAMPHRPDIASLSAVATGQPLLAPGPMHTQFTYSPQGHMTPQPYQQVFNNLWKIFQWNKMI